MLPIDVVTRRIVAAGSTSMAEISERADHPRRHDDGRRDRHHQEQRRGARTSMPLIAATSRSKVAKVNSRRYATTNADTAQPDDRSSRPRRLVRTPSTFPNRTASSERPTARDRLWMTSPIANEAVVTTPIAASAPIVPRPATRAISSAVNNAPQPGAEEVRGAERSRDRSTSEHGVRQAVADVAHRPQHDVHADQAAQRAGEHGDEHARAGRSRRRTARTDRSRTTGAVTPIPAGGRAARAPDRARPACHRAAARSSVLRRCARARTGGAPPPAARRR